MNIEKGATSLDVIKEIISEHSEIASLTLILHGVSINWRQRYGTDHQKVSHVEESLVQKTPIKSKTISRQDFLNLDEKTLDTNSKHQVWSLTSKVTTGDGRIMHLPMMNFHPTDDITTDDIVEFIKIVVPDKDGFVLHSGRYFHYYGCYLLTEDEWIKFNAKFLMPCVFVSPRYVGHVLQDGYSSLRFTNDDKYKPTIPRVIHRIDNQTS